MNTFASACQTTLAALEKAWSTLWFRDITTLPLEIARIGIGAAMLIHYSPATPLLFEFWGDTGLMPRRLVLSDDPWRQSVFFHFSAPWQWIAFHCIFLFGCAALMSGWRTSWVKWIVLIGQISYDYRNPTISYGVDNILACLLLLLCVAPIGRAISFDRLRAIRAAKRACPDAILLPYSSPWAGACTRLMQIQLATLFFFSGITKIRGEEWWNGDAIWVLFSTNEYYNPFLLDLLAHHYWLVNLATYLTLLIELAYPFLIWQRSTRPFLLAAAIFLHVQFALLMGLWYFSFVMIMGHLSFLRPEWLSRLKEAWSARRRSDRFHLKAFLQPGLW